MANLRSSIEFGVLDEYAPFWKAKDYRDHNGKPPDSLVHTKMDNENAWDPSGKQIPFPSKNKVVEKIQ